jgi:auxin efflux carrier family
MSLDGRREPVLTETEIGDNGKLHVKVRRSVSTVGGGGGVHIAADHLACMQMSSGRSLGLTSLADTIAAAARPSNLTGAEIYSLHSSVNLTPRDSSFNQNDFYKMMQQQAGRFSPPAYDHHRQSNVTATSDVYSLHDSSRGITPRTSNFNEESSKDYLQYSYPKPGGAAAAVPCSINNYSPQFTSSQITKRIMDPPHSAKASASVVSSSSLVDENAKELHMFVWSANASPISESRGGGGGGGGGQLHVFGGCEFNTPDYAQEYDAKEVQMLVHSHHHAQYQAQPNATGMMS